MYSALSMVQSVRAGLSPLRPWREALAAALAVPVDAVTDNLNAVNDEPA